jgi:hypothetical protein
MADTNKVNRLRWNDLTFPPINLWTAPSLTVIEFKVKGNHGRQKYSTNIKPNPIFLHRSHN